MAGKAKKSKRKKEPQECHRAYPLEHAIHPNKLVKIIAVRNPYRKLAARIGSLQWRYFFEASIQPSKYREELPKTPLSDRFQRNAECQVVGMLQSWISNRVNDFRNYVTKSSLDPEVKHQLHTINTCKAWYYRPEKPTNPQIIAHLELMEARREARSLKEGKDPLPLKDPPYLEFAPEVFQLARWVMRAVMNRNRKPSYDDINMQLNANVAKLMPRQVQLPKNHLKSKDPEKPRNCSGCYLCQPATKYEFWVKFSTLEANKPIYLPLSDTKYRQKQGGKLCESLQFNWNRFDELQVVLTHEKPTFAALSLEEQQERLAQFGGSLSGDVYIDTGLVIPLATDKGTLHGLSLFEQLKKYDARLVHLTKELTEQGIPLRSNQRYLRLQQDIRGTLKNEIHRCLNRIVAIHCPERIVIDKLDFRDSQLSRSLNRIIRNCGLGAIKKKLAQLTEDYGIIIEYMNPAYSSQECNSCGYIDPKNRKGRRFKCLLCQHTIHADVSGARAGKRRSEVHPSLSLLPITEDTHRSVVLRLLVHRFVGQFQTLRPEHPLQRLRSKAKGLILRNLYYKDYWDLAAKGFQCNIIPEMG